MTFLNKLKSARVQVKLARWHLAIAITRIYIFICAACPASISVSATLRTSNIYHVWPLMLCKEKYNSI